MSLEQTENYLFYDPDLAQDAGESAPSEKSLETEDWVSGSLSKEEGPKGSSSRKSRGSAALPESSMDNREVWF